MVLDKKAISDIALKIVKEVIKDKKYKSLTQGVINNTDKEMTEEQVKRILEEVNKKVFTMIYNEREDKDFQFDIALIEEVFSSKEYKKGAPKVNILSKKNKSASLAVFADSEDKLRDVFKAACFIVGDSEDDNFGIEAYKIASEIIFDSVLVSEGTKTASVILDIMKRNKRILKTQDSNIEKFLTEKKGFLYDEFIDIVKEASLDMGMAFNSFSRVLPSYMMLKNNAKDLNQEFKDSGVSKADFFKNYASGKAFETFLKPMT